MWEVLSSISYFSRQLNHWRGYKSFCGGRLYAGVNREGVKYYNYVISELLVNGIELYVTLFHWDFPQALEDEYGGFLNHRVVDDFVEYAEYCFWEFGDLH